MLKFSKNLNSKKEFGIWDYFYSNYFIWYEKREFWHKTCEILVSHYLTIQNLFYNILQVSTQK